MCAGMVGILFVITIDPKIASTPFADITGGSQFGREAAILFTAHTVFQLADVKILDEVRNLFEA